jgi:enamine deaminase RidA (YjgF/YER057c/UK114 family)
MTGQIEKKIKSLGLKVPAAPAPAGNYVPFVVTGNLIFLAGQIPLTADGPQFQGKVGADLTIEHGQAAARLCVLNMFAHLKNALDGDLDRLTACVKLGGFVNAAAGFDQHPQVINGASDLMVAILGDNGRHARFALGAASLPLDVAVEIDGVFEFK